MTPKELAKVIYNEAADRVEVRLETLDDSVSYDKDSKIGGMGEVVLGLL